MRFDAADLIGDNNSRDDNVAVGLVLGLYCRAGAGTIQFSGDTVLVMRPYFRAGSGSILQAGKYRFG